MLVLRRSVIVAASEANEQQVERRKRLHAARLRRRAVGVAIGCRCISPRPSLKERGAAPGPCLLLIRPPLFRPAHQRTRQFIDAEGVSTRGDDEFAELPHLAGLQLFGPVFERFQLRVKVPVAPVLRRGARDDEVETVAIRIFTGPRFACDVEPFELAGHVSPLAEIRPPNPRSKATVRAVSSGNIAALAATAFIALLVVFAVDSNNRIWRTEQCSGGESVRFSVLGRVRRCSHVSAIY
jgi:hypothetical protein